MVLVERETYREIDRHPYKERVQDRVIITLLTQKHLCSSTPCFVLDEHVQSFMHWHVYVALVAVAPSYTGTFV